MYKNKFTIVIPTRERCETLYYTIATCLNQTYEKLTVIVSDNYSADKTKQVAESFADDRLVYVNTGCRVSMSANFEYGLSHVDSDSYVMFIGDDDGVLPNTLDYVNDALNSTKCRAIVSHNAAYTWPGTPSPNRLYWSPKGGYEVRNSKEWLRRFLDFRMSYTFDLPGAYCGFVHKQEIDRMSVGGKFFMSATPDAYSALAMAYSLEEYIYSHRAFAVHGASVNSNGAAYFSKRKGREGAEAVKFFKENSIPFHSDIVMAKSFRICAMEAFLQLKDTFNIKDSSLAVDWCRFLAFVLSEARVETEKELKDAVQCMAKKHGISFEDILKYSLNEKKVRLSGFQLKRFVEKLKNSIWKRTHKKSKLSNLELSTFGVQNIAEAVIVLSLIQDLK